MHNRNSEVLKHKGTENQDNQQGLREMQNINVQVSYTNVTDDWLTN
jgi:hypothetical protein